MTSPRCGQYSLSDVHYRSVTKIRTAIDSSFAQLIQPNSPLAADYTKSQRDLKHSRAVIETLAAYLRADTQEVQVKLMLTALDGALTPTSALLQGSSLDSLRYVTIALYALVSLS